MQLRTTLFLSLFTALVLVSAQSSSPTPTVSLTPQEVYSEEIARQSAAAAATSLASQLGLSTLSFASVDTAKYTGVPSSSIPGGYQGDTSGLGWTTVTGTAMANPSASVYTTVVVEGGQSMVLASPTPTPGSGSSSSSGLSQGAKLGLGLGLGLGGGLILALAAIGTILVRKQRATEKRDFEKRTEALRQMSQRPQVDV